VSTSSAYDSGEVPVARYTRCVLAIGTALKAGNVAQQWALNWACLSALKMKAICRGTFTSEVPEVFTVPSVVPPEKLRTTGRDLGRKWPSPASRDVTVSAIACYGVTKITIDLLHIWCLGRGSNRVVPEECNLCFRCGNRIRCDETVKLKTKTKLHGLSPRANYTDRRLSAK
jgi:hypothetical protein